MFTPVNKIFPCLKQYEPDNDKTNKMTCASREDSYQPGHPASLIRARGFDHCVLYAPSEDSVQPGYLASSRQRSDQIQADTQAGLSLHWVHRLFCWFYYAVAQLQQCQRKLVYDKTEEQLLQSCQKRAKPAKTRGPRPLWVIFLKTHKDVGHQGDETKQWVSVGDNYGLSLEGNLREKVSLSCLTSPYFELKEKFQCIKHIGKSKFGPKLLFEILKM